MISVEEAEEENMPQNEAQAAPEADSDKNDVLLCTVEEIASYGATAVVRTHARCEDVPHGCYRLVPRSLDTHTCIHT